MTVDPRSLYELLVQEPVAEDAQRTCAALRGPLDAAIAAVTKELDSHCLHLWGDSCDAVTLTPDLEASTEMVRIELSAGTSVTLDEKELAGADPGRRLRVEELGRKLVAMNATAQLLG